VRHLLKACGIAAATVTALAVATPSAIADENTYTFTCQGFGSGAHEPLGDREGHALSISDYSCYTDFGPFVGGDVSGTNIWEWDRTNAVLVTGQYISRKPGSIAVHAANEGKLSLTMTDGKVTRTTTASPPSSKNRTKISMLDLSRCSIR
jgi:hypothetical protein